MKIRTKSTGTDKKGVCWSTLNPLVIILRAHFYTGIPRMCVLRSEHPRHLNVWGVLRHCVPNKGLRSLAPLCGYPLKTKCVTKKVTRFA